MSRNYAIGIDLGGTYFVVGVVDRSGTLLVKKSQPTIPERPFEATVQNIAETVLLVISDAGIKIEEIAGTGFGVPSTIDPNTKKMIFANNLSWLDVDLIGEYEKHIPGLVFIDNDADCAALGEVITDPDFSQNVLMITFGTGFGGALVIDGKIFRGCDGYGIEPGHYVQFYGGRKCNCGMRGCVEAYVSVPALVEQSREKMAVNPKSLMWDSCLDSAGNRDPALVNGHTAFIAARKGDKTALELIEEFTNMAGQAIGSLITLYRPEKVIIGGGLCNEGDFFISPLYKAAKKCYFGSGLMPMPHFVKARLGNDAGIIGAAMLVLSL